MQKSRDVVTIPETPTEAQQHGKISGRDAQGELIPKLMRFHSPSKDGTAGCFSEQGPAQSECATNPLGDFFNTPLRIAGLQRLLGRQGVSFW